MGAEFPSQIKQTILKRAFKTAAECCDAICNLFFYLPCGGEASFRNKCVKFASLKEGDCILDLCCGTGNLAAAIAKQGITVKLLGVDISESAIETARAKSWSIPVTFLITSAGDLPFESSQFDKCFISFGLHHMSRNERRKTLAEVHRTLVTKGNLYVIDYNLPGKGLRRFAAVALTKLDNKGEAFIMLKSGKLIREIEEAGFEIAERALTYHGIIQLLQAVKKQAAK